MTDSLYFKIAFIILGCTNGFFIQPAYSQLHINNTLSPEQWVQNYFVGQGITITNITYFSDDSLASGVFSGNSNIGFNKGIIITNGIDTLAKGPNNHGHAGILGTYSFPYDIDLGLVQFLVHQWSTPIFKTRTLEFDFIPSGDSIFFRYVFASEEYNENVEGPFTNVCGIFLSGPGIVGNPLFSNNARNLAVIPDTNLPVCSRYLNNGPAIWGQPASGPCKFCNYLVDNALLDPLDSTRVQYDGFTTPLLVKAKVNPCQTYHLKIGIGKYPGTSFDSGIFLEAGSFTSPITKVQTSFTSTNNPLYADTFAIEGCRNATLHIKLPDVKADTQFVIIDSISGSAEINTDFTLAGAGFQYHPVDHSAIILIPPFQDSADIIVTPIYDGITEATELVRFYIKTSVCDSIGHCTIIPIIDYQHLIINAGSDTSVCESSVGLNLIINGGIPPYNISWSPVSTLSNPNITGPVASPVQDTWYFAQVQDTVGCSSGRDSVFVAFYNRPVLSAFIASPDSGCEMLQVHFSCQSSLPGTYLWCFGDGSFSQASNPVHEYVYGANGLYNSWVKITTADGCVSADSLSSLVTVFPKPVSAFSFQPDTGIILSNPNLVYPVIQFTNASSNGAILYFWNFGDTSLSTSTLTNPSFSYNQPGNYQVWLVAQTSHSCSDSISKSITIIQEKQIELEIPNIVTPNSDGKNDQLIIRNLEFCSQYKLYIFNRWGNLLFESSDYQNDWPSLHVDDGTYYYFLQYTLFNREEKAAGSLTVLR